MKKATHKVTLLSYYFQIYHILCKYDLDMHTITLMFENNIIIKTIAGQSTSPNLCFASKDFSQKKHRMVQHKTSGPSCSKLTMSLVNDSLKF